MGWKKLKLDLTRRKRERLEKKEAREFEEVKRRCSEIAEAERKRAAEEKKRFEAIIRADRMVERVAKEARYVEGPICGYEMYTGFKYGGNPILRKELEECYKKQRKRN